MTSRRPKLVFLDDDSEYLDALRNGLGSDAEDSRFFSAQDEFLEFLESEEANAVQAVFVDLHMGRSNGVEVLKRVQGLRSSVRKVLLTAYAANPSERLALQRLGVHEQTKASADSEVLIALGGRDEGLETRLGRQVVREEGARYVGGPAAPRSLRAFREPRIVLEEDFGRITSLHVQEVRSEVVRSGIAARVLHRWRLARRARVLATELHDAAVSSVWVDLLSHHHAWLGPETILVLRTYSWMKDNRWRMFWLGRHDAGAETRTHVATAMSTDHAEESTIIGRLADEIVRAGILVDNGVRGTPGSSEHARGGPIAEASHETFREAESPVSGLELGAQLSEMYFRVVRDMMASSGEVSVRGLGVFKREPSSRWSFRADSELQSHVTAPFGISRLPLSLRAVPPIP